MSYKNTVIRRLLHKLVGSLKSKTLYDILLYESSINKTIHCIQVGANNGIDQYTQIIKNYQWKGVLIEPLPDVFHKQLKETYANQNNLNLENVAISDANGIKDIYKLSISEARWATGLTSFVKSNIEKHINNGYVLSKAKDEGVDNLPDDKSKWIKVEKIKCVTFAYLIEKYKIKELDILMIDTEGFDFEIIKMFDFNLVKPRIIIFEQEHLNEEDKQACIKLLKSQNYNIYWDGGMDMLASLVKYKVQKNIKLL